MTLTLLVKGFGNAETIIPDVELFPMSVQLLTLIKTEPELTHPFALAPVRVKVVLTIGLTTICVLDVPVLQVYVTPPPAVKVEDSFAQIENLEAVAVITGSAKTVTVEVTGCPTHPLVPVPVTP